MVTGVETMNFFFSFLIIIEKKIERWKSLSAPLFPNLVRSIPVLYLIQSSVLGIAYYALYTTQSVNILRVHHIPTHAHRQDDTSEIRRVCRDRNLADQRFGYLTLVKLGSLMT